MYKKSIGFIVEIIIEKLINRKKRNLVEEIKIKDYENVVRSIGSTKEKL
jgi:hypothetical protein